MTPLLRAMRCTCRRGHGLCCWSVVEGRRGSLVFAFIASRAANEMLTFLV